MSYPKLIQERSITLSFYSINPIISFKNALKAPDVESLKLAAQFLVWEIWRDLQNQLIKGDFQRLNEYKNGKGIIFAEGRVEKFV